MDIRKKGMLEKIINTGYRNMAGLVVLRDSETVYEHYYNGYTADCSVHVASVTKSIFCLLLGIAIEEGYIERVDQKILSFFPEYQIQTGERTLPKVTIKDMLTMTVPYKYKYEPYEMYFSSEDWVKFALNAMGGKGPIGEFRYTPIIGPDILGSILMRATGESVLTFAQKRLFSPLGIHVDQSVELKNKEEHLAYANRKTTTGWVAGPTGVHTVGWGLSMTPMDMAKIGQLLLNGGTWNGQQIVSKAWITDCTSRHSQWKQFGYGYLWWILDEKDGVYAALGDGGNAIYVNPKKKMVVATGALYKPGTKAKDRIELIKDYVIPAFEA